MKKIANKIEKGIRKTLKKHAKQDELPKKTEKVIYILLGNSIIHGGKRKYISARKLCVLYDLDRESCQFVEIHDLPRRKIVDLIIDNNIPKYIVLEPREQGDYKNHLEKIINLRGVVNGYITTV